MKNSHWGGQLIGTRDVSCGTKDTHINFGECLDSIDWEEADLHCGKADLCIIAGTSMSLRHITHFPFKAKKVVLINLQPTPDDDEADLRIWAQCDAVFEGLMHRLNVSIDPVPCWRPRDSLLISEIPKWIHPYYVERAKALEEMFIFRKAEHQERLLLEKKASEQALVDSLQKLSLKKDFIIGNKTKVKPPSYPGDPNIYSWKMFIRLSSELEKQGFSVDQFVESVDYKLHPTFCPPIVRVDQAPFQCSRRGWGTFHVGVTVHFKPSLGRQPLVCDHELVFSRPQTAQIVSF